MKPTQDELTVQEDLIVAWRAMGLCHKQIAALLHRSEKVVSWHLGNIKKKLGLPIKAIADRLGMKVKMVEYHWANAQRIIRHQVNNSKL